MIGKVIRPARDFMRVLSYLLQKEKAEVLGYKGIRGFLDQGDMARDFQLQARMNPAVRSPVGHFVLSFSKEDLDKLGPAGKRGRLMRERALEFLGKMRVRHTQVLLVRHYDREPEGLHMHLVYNRVSDSGKALDGAYLKYHNRRVCQQMNMRYGYSNGKQGLYPINGPRLRGYERVNFQVKSAIHQRLPSSDNLQELKDQLKAFHGIDMRLRRDPDTGQIQGVSYRYKEVSLKAVHTGLAYPKLKAYFQRKLLRERSIRYGQRALLQKPRARKSGLRIR